MPAKEIREDGSRRHVVRQGECCASIASMYGFDWRTVWEDPENDRLREQRRRPELLLDGDVLFIPARRLREERRPTGARHRFVAIGRTVQIRVQFLRCGEARASEPYVLHAGRIKCEGHTDRQGMVEARVPAGVQNATLILGEGEGSDVYELKIGHLDPAETVTGIQQRLQNLGFPCSISGELDGRTRAALQEFKSAKEQDSQTQVDEDELHQLLAAEHRL